MKQFENLGIRHGFIIGLIGIGVWNLLDAALDAFLMIIGA